MPKCAPFLSFIYIISYLAKCSDAQRLAEDVVANFHLDDDDDGDVDDDDGDEGASTLLLGLIDQPWVCCPPNITLRSLMIMMEMVSCLYLYLYLFVFVFPFPLPGGCAARPTLPCSH